MTSARAPAQAQDDGSLECKESSSNRALTLGLALAGGCLGLILCLVGVLYAVRNVRSVGGGIDMSDIVLRRRWLAAHSTTRAVISPTHVVKRKDLPAGPDMVRA